ncbi:outer membrane protein assembly factor BamC [Gilliamella sp. Pra-s65]|uniref:outer membrane protein assembly factor BamC n=1 Tax=unclassified Gilliamella TaxID=2685620 RepID=UPI0013652C36|nr:MULTISPECIES: outer membrane protein assembly factor BamC [unclassified Gilliamella]MWN90538.1 outer membrane protein assembly factor BamC [Gilliamella sp. Pra-s65]MWP73553.1 outer membrane protein assembly factor BamC [Gilliamella sp. Pra-s52]
MLNNSLNKILSRTLFKNNGVKKVAILTIVASLFLAGCGNDQNFKREVDGNEDYLQSPSLKSLIIPEGFLVPIENGDFYIDKTEYKGALGKKLDIRPPSLPILTIPDAFAIYNRGTVTFNSPLSSQVWERIPNSLSKRNISIASQDSNSIQTGKSFIVRADEEQAVEASYSIKRQLLGDTETITILLTSLTRGADDLTSQPIEVQRYVVGLFNDIMDDVAPDSMRVVPPKSQDKSDEEKDKSESKKPATAVSGAD